MKNNEKKVENDIEISSAHEVELHNRIAEDKAGRMPWHSLDEVKLRLDAHKCTRD